ncbi:Molybdopterin-guanine dinucleotide biosynthesis protein A [Archaeoglobus sulfaticallidus PM70-1]|uniref:Probable molybdenum cofactor guanylyltransferase n=1 Tax=Archaeoglobus sulfaticallidus PM70-1 TaxID=387631 RepID=N0BIR2_9EURY|nr:molybdenum cofactor guanylyltransferase [Archaeoglobus sulfaticallidus]AGK62222.1 Molybdopterin-guanine dinucleotide biosynthesis protein A [Archaeoglobus sulfaticallidus PM70-1]
MYAVILAGGYGRRLGYTEKGLIEIGGKPIISKIIDSLTKFEIIISCRDENQAEKYERFGEVVVDILKDFGPLSGIHSALKKIGERAVFISADMPFVKQEICEAIYRECEGYDAAIPIWNDGKLEPTLSAYSPAVTEKIEQCYRKNIRKVLCAIHGLEKVKYIPIENLKQYDRKLISFMNINTPEDLRKAEIILKTVVQDVN